MLLFYLEILVHEAPLGTTFIILVSLYVFLGSDRANCTRTELFPQSVLAQEKALALRCPVACSPAGGSASSSSVTLLTCVLSFKSFSPIKAHVPCHMLEN